MIELGGDAAWFWGRCGPFLEARIECNVLATVVTGALEEQFAEDRAPMFAVAVEGDGTVVGAVLRTPPRPMLCSALPASAVDGLMERWLQRDPAPGGVVAPAATARAIAGAWAARTGGATRCRSRMALHALDEVVGPARPATGALRAAVVGEQELLASWWQAFAVEADEGPADPAAARDAVSRALAAGLLEVWEDAGEPVSMVCVNPSVAGIVRIGPVYTPPARRRRGYAGSAVAAASRRALETGARRCTLFTDVANPTSNRIYAEVGYRRFADWEEHDLAPLG